MGATTTAVRLNSRDREAIIEVVCRWCPGLRSLALFGSRTDLSKRGGDIDLWIELDAEPSDPSLLVRTLRRHLQDRMGEQKIDLQISGPLDEIRDPQMNFFHQYIQPSKVPLWTKDPSPGS